MQAFWRDLAHDITLIDTGYQRPGFDASYLLTAGGEAAFVDVGTTLSVPRLLHVLTAKGIAPDAVRYVMVTHVHLDHAGGAGALLRQLPRAELVVHPRGAAHLVDPTKLIAGATAVYGEERLRAAYGEIAAVSAARVVEAADGYELAWNGRHLAFLDTPGHARHHYCIYDEASRGVFAGDSFGLSYREFDTADGAFIFPTTTPVQFDPQAMHASIDRLLGLRPQRIYLTHYGCVEDPPRLAARLHALIDEFVALAQASAASDHERHRELVDGLAAMLWRALQRHGCDMPRARALELLVLDIELNAQGLAVWLDRGNSRA